MTLLLMVFLLA